MQPLRRTLNTETRVIDARKGIIEYVASDETLDSFREIIRANGWRFTNFQKNAPFVDSHNYGSVEKLLGKVIDFRVQGRRLVETVQWAIDAGLPEEHLANIGWKMTVAGYLKAVSVGFFPTKMASQHDSDSSTYNGQLRELGLSKVDDSLKPRTVFIEQEQAELSCCILGSNPNAMAKAYRDCVISAADMAHLKHASVSPLRQMVDDLTVKVPFPEAASAADLRRYEAKKLRSFLGLD